MFVPTLQGDRVTLRPLEDADLSPLLVILLQPGVIEWWPGYDMSRLRADTFGSPDTTPLAIELDAEFVGLIMFSEVTDPYYTSASIDIALDAEYLGQGLGSDAMRALARYLFEGRGHHRLSIDPAVTNERAIAAYRKVGFQPVGVARAYERGAEGTWHDNLLMDMLPEDLR
jgi:aminoglycoside 6'-N-acetyltransferase